MASRPPASLWMWANYQMAATQVTVVALQSNMPPGSSVLSCFHTLPTPQAPPTPPKSPYLAPTPSGISSMSPSPQGCYPSNSSTSPLHTRAVGTLCSYFCTLVAPPHTDSEL